MLGDVFHSEAKKPSRGVLKKRSPMEDCFCLFNSRHPKQCKNNIPFTFARQICTIVENSEVREKRLVKLREVLYS